MLSNCAGVAVARRGFADGGKRSSAPLCRTTKIKPSRNPAERGVSIIEQELKSEVVVRLVRADPEPVEFAAALSGECAVAATDLDGVDAAFFLEAQRRMSRVGFEEREILVGKFLDVPGELFITLPKGSEHVGLHGMDVNFPASISASILASASACLPPAEKSSSSC